MNQERGEERRWRKEEEARVEEGGSRKGEEQVVSLHHNRWAKLRPLYQVT